MANPTRTRLNPPLNKSTRRTAPIGHRKSVFTSSPPAESLPPPVFDNTSNESIVSKTRNIHVVTRSFCQEDASNSWIEALLPAVAPQQLRHFDATVVSISSDTELPSAWNLGQCPPWSKWASSQFAFDYMCMLITSSSTAPELFIRRYRAQYMDALYRLEKIIGSIGIMPDGSPPPSFFQSFYHLRRLFPNGLLAPEDFKGEVGTTLLIRVFATGIAVANQAIYEQRNYNLNWEDMCGIPDAYVDSFEMTALSALSADVFDLSQDRTLYLDWLGHLGYHAEFHHCLTAYPYLRSSADVIAFAHAQAFSLPSNYQRRRIRPIHLPSLEKLSLMLCWGTGVTPIPPMAIQFNHLDYSLRDIRATPGNRTPTAADVLADLAEECSSRLLYPLSVRATFPHN